MDIAGGRIIMRVIIKLHIESSRVEIGLNDSG